jgi:putative tricarboxylic transport membrane protein
MNKERLEGLFFFLVALYAFVSSLGLSIGSLRQPGAGMFPLILSVLLFIVALSIFFSREAKGTRVVLGQWGKPLLIIILTAGFIGFLERLGYLATASLYLFALFLTVSRFSFWKTAGLAGFLGSASWYFFEKILALHLPAGPWGW